VTRRQQKDAGLKNENRFCGGLADSRKMPDGKMKTASFRRHFSASHFSAFQGLHNWRSRF
jgi:hypothetical protein